MNNKFSKLIILGLVIIFGSSIFAFSTQASNGLSLQLIKGCDIEYAGDRCAAELEITNSTGEILEGEAFFSVGYNGICGSGPFDGEGITAEILINGKTFNFSNDWNNGTTTVSGFDIEKNTTYPNLEINTVPGLCPGKYTYTLTVKGTSESGEEFTASVGGGGGGGFVAGPPTTNTGEITATPGRGGITTFSNPDGSEIELTIPPNAVSEDTTFTTERRDIDSVTSPEAGIFLINGLVYEISAESNGETVTSFNEPLELSFTYLENQIEDMGENALWVSWWNGSEWSVVENRILDRENNIVTVSVDHLTLFALTSRELGFVEEETVPEMVIEEETEAVTEAGEESLPVGGEEMEAAEPEEEETGEPAPELIGEAELPPRTPAGLLAAATFLTLGTGNNMVSILIAFLILIILAFIYDKYLRKSKKPKVQGF